MKKTLVAMAAAASFASAVVAAPSQADAACWGCYVGAGVAAGAIGGALSVRAPHTHMAPTTATARPITMRQRRSITDPA